MGQALFTTHNSFHHFHVIKEKDLRTWTFCCWCRSVSLSSSWISNTQPERSDRLESPRSVFYQCWFFFPSGKGDRALTCPDISKYQLLTWKPCSTLPGERWVAFTQRDCAFVECHSCFAVVYALYMFSLFMRKCSLYSNLDCKLLRKNPIKILCTLLMLYKELSPNDKNPRWLKFMCFSLLIT